MPRMSEYRPKTVANIPITSLQKEDDDIVNETWSPTKEQFKAFLARDAELAQRNIKLALQTFSYPVTVKDLKDSSLHSLDTLEQTLIYLVSTGTVQANERDLYSLSPVITGRQ